MTWRLIPFRSRTTRTANKKLIARAIFSLYCYRYFAARHLARKLQGPSLAIIIVSPLAHFSTSLDY
jgi:hypothetical protein